MRRTRLSGSDKDFSLLHVVDNLHLLATLDFLASQLGLLPGIYTKLPYSIYVWHFPEDF